MDYRQTAYGLGLFSIALGLTEVVAGKRIARALGAGDKATLVRGFGVRELAAGGALLAAPAHSTNMWMRVAGDAIDLTGLGLAARRNPANRNVWGALAFVAAAMAVDVLVAKGLDRTTGKMLPARA